MKIFNRKIPKKAVDVCSVCFAHLSKSEAIVLTNDSNIKCLICGSKKGEKNNGRTIL